MATTPVPPHDDGPTEPAQQSGEVVSVYLRKSTKDKRRSVERQLTDITDAARREGLQLGTVFVDPDFSASRYRRKDRPDFAALVKHIRAGDCRILGIAEVSRGSRDNTEWSGFLDLCRDLGVRIWVSTHERIYDLSRRRDWRALADEGLDAADESEKISERVRSGKRKAAQKGRPHGKLSYGFTRIYDETGAFVEQRAHPERAPVVREMVTRIAEGDELKEIARDLNQRGITTAGGAAWTGQHIGELVKRPAYIGRRIHQGVDIGPAGWEPIVDVDTWHKAMAVLSRDGRRTSPRGTGLTYWLTNAMRCGRCKDVYLQAWAGGAKQRDTVYRCNKCVMTIAARSLERYVELTLLSRLSQPDAVAAFVPRTDDAATAAAKKVLDDLNADLAEWKALAKAKKVSPASFAEFEADLLPKIHQAEEKWRALAVPPEIASLDLTAVPERWPSFAEEEKRRHVRALIKVVVHPATSRGPRFDPGRLSQSRWVGDARTWGELSTME
jgi:site-specific DNA recombinase